MKCVCCEQETPISESRSYLDFTFGIARKGRRTATADEESAVRTLQRLYHPVCSWNWHGAARGAAASEPFPGLYPGVELNGEQVPPRLPPLRKLQADLFFCSTTCLRTWLNRIVDEIESMLQEAGQVQGQLTNPSGKMRRTTDDR